MSNLMAVNYEVDGQPIQLTQQDVMNYLVSGNADKVTDKEIKLFMELCKAQGLNPFIREAYLIKFGQDAQIIVGKDVFLKRARANPDFKGFKAGVIVQNEKGIEKREGTFYIPQMEKLVGGWADVYIEGWAVPFQHTVALHEFNKSQSTWKNMPAVMIRKTALVQALREAFPEDLQALYDQSEMGTPDPDFTTTEVQQNVNVENYEDAKSYEVMDGETISDAQARRLFSIAKDESLVRGVLTKYGYTSTKDILKSDYEAISSDIEVARDLVDEE